jgi:hypothetical protein
MIYVSAERVESRRKDHSPELAAKGRRFGVATAEFALLLFFYSSVYSRLPEEP